MNKPFTSQTDARRIRGLAVMQDGNIVVTIPTRIDLSNDDALRFYLEGQDINPNEVLGTKAVRTMEWTNTRPKEIKVTFDGNVIKSALPPEQAAESVRGV